MGNFCSQSTNTAASNPQDPLEDGRKTEPTPTPRRNSSSPASSSGSPYRIKRSNSVGSSSTSSNKKAIVARAKIRRAGSGSWTADRKSAIRGLGRARLKKKNSEEKSAAGVSPTDASQPLGAISKTDFIMDSYAIGKGSFGFVRLGKHKRNSMCYALKQTRKIDIVKKKGIKFVLRERSSLKSIQHPFVVGFIGSFQDRSCLYLVLEYVPGGDLGWLSSRSDNHRLLEEDARFYAAEMLIGLKFLHTECFMMHRDIKPDNILIDAKGHIKIADFGFAKKVNSNGRCHSHLGTPHYLAPEQLDIHNKNGYTTCVDWWSFAVTLYVLVAGDGPFGNNNDTRYEVYLKVMRSKYKLPSLFSSSLKKLIKAMFQLKESKRLTDVNAIMNHKWFADVDWVEIEKRDMAPPFVPSIIKNGKSNFTKIELRDIDNDADLQVVNNNYEMFAAF